MKIVVIFCLLSSFLLPAQQKNTPNERAHHTAVYDPQLKGFVIYGGFIFRGKGPKPTGDVWLWNGSTWREVASTETRKIVAPLAFDSKRQRLLMFGGSDSTGKEDGKLAAFENGQWRTLIDSPAIARGDPGLVYDKKRDRLVLFGGTKQGHFFGDTWEFDGHAWKQVSSTGPSPRSGVAITYDAARGKTVLYGGFAPGAELSDTWEWDGKNWKQVSTDGPGPRAWANIAYDTKRHQSILFGGEDTKEGSQLYTDTWAWNGNAWKRLATEGPTGRIQFAMDYDQRRDRVVLFGGFTIPPHYLHDTWEFDGAAWVEQNK